MNKEGCEKKKETKYISLLFTWVGGGIDVSEYFRFIFYSTQ